MSRILFCKSDIYKSINLRQIKTLNDIGTIIITVIWKFDRINLLHCVVSAVNYEDMLFSFYLFLSEIRIFMFKVVKIGKIYGCIINSIKIFVVKTLKLNGNRIVGLILNLLKEHNMWSQ